MKENQYFVFALCITAFILLITYSCSSSIPNIALKKDYNFQNKKSVIVYVDPADKQALNETYARVLYLDLTARGYDVINANQLLQEYSDNVSGKTHREIADSLLAKRYLPKPELIAVVRTNWDSCLILTYFSESRVAKQKHYSFAGVYAKTLKAQVAFFDHLLREPILSFTASDTAYIYAEDDNSKLIYSEFPWMIAAKQISKHLNEIPICSVNNPTFAKTQFKISLWVDNSYRKEFPDSWKDRLVLRVLYANDILRSQFDSELVIKEIVEWDSEFGGNLRNTLTKLSRNGTSKNDYLKIGITVNKKLKNNWKDRDYLGLSYLLNKYIAITSQPSFPDVGQYWNPIEEAITLVHEVGHSLGAIHCDDNTSIMFPVSGTLSYEFDEINRKIIETTKNNFYNPDKKQKVKAYLQVLNELRKSQNGSKISVLEAANSSMSDLLESVSFKDENNSELTSMLISVSPDTAFAYAIEGFIDFTNYRFEQAKKHFTKALEMDPGFTEVNQYLKKIPEKIRNEVKEINKDKLEITPKNSKAAKKIEYK